MKLQLKNKEERELFLNSYTQWEEWKAIPELGLTFYRWQFKNGDAFIVTEYQVYPTAYTTRLIGQKYHLLLSKNSHGKSDKHIHHPEQYYKYDPYGSGTSTLIEYLTKNRDNLESITRFREV